MSPAEMRAKPEVRLWESNHVTRYGTAGHQKVDGTALKTTLRCRMLMSVVIYCAKTMSMLTLL